MGKAAIILLLCGLLAQSSSGRKFLQTSITDCTWLHPDCTSCEAQNSNTGTVVSCLACTSPAYRVTTDTLGCECSPGYFPPINDSKTCSICGRGSFCSGGIAGRQECGELLTTLSATASNLSACITLPGVAYMSGAGTSIQCPVSTYNLGGNQRNCTGRRSPCPSETTSLATGTADQVNTPPSKPCSCTTKCPGELVTSALGVASIESCQAPPGYFYRNRQALPCAVGSYKPGINKNTVCQTCPEGTTTRSTQSNSSADCSVVLPGYKPIFNNAGTVVIGATPCPIGTYSTDGQKCTPCTTGLTTEATKSTAASACVAPPGFGFYPEGVPSDFPARQNDSTVVACPIGWFKAGFALDPCTSCGVALLTDAVASTSADACYIPAGYGSKHVYVPAAATNPSDVPAMVSAMMNISNGLQEPQQLVAAKCGMGSYGAESKHYGLEPLPCQPCPEHTTTPDAFPDAGNMSDVTAMLMTSIHNCSNTAGYGYQHGIAAECPTGFYNPGYNLQPCTVCGVGLTTAKPGATANSDCIAKPGWQLVGVANATSCPTGTWSAGGIQPLCTPCSAGSTTVGPASPSANECSVCLPGWGAAMQQANAVDAQADTSAMCEACEYGFYSPGGVSTCVSCQEGYTSPTRSADSSACVPVWSSVEPYTSIVANTSALVRVEAAGAPVCQQQCATITDCQFWIYRTQQQDASDNGCWLKSASTTASPNTFIAFKLITGDYTVWPADTESDSQIGDGIAWIPEDAQAATSASQCLDACDASASCLGIWTHYSWNINWECKLMRGQFRHRESSAIQAVPSRINNAIWAQAEPAADAPASSTPITNAHANDTTPPAAPADNVPVTDAPAANNTPASNPADSSIPVDAAGFVEPTSDSPANTPATEVPVATNTPADSTTATTVEPTANAPAIETPAINVSGTNGPVSPAANTPAAVDGTGSTAVEPTTNVPVDDTSVTNTPAAETQATNTPVNDTAAINIPVNDTAATNTPAAESPATNTPVNDTAATDTPAADAPAAQTPATNTPAAETTATNIPVNDTAATNTPAAEKLATNTPVNDTAAADTPAADAPAAETPATNTPAADTPAADTPAADTPAAETPGTNTPAADAPATNTPAADTPATNTPMNDTAASNTPAADTTAAETPATNTPVNGTAATNIPAADTPATNTPAAETPAINTPVNDTAAADTPTADAPAAETPATNTPAADTPAADTPAAETPATNTPVIDTPATNTPAADSPAANIPAAETPATNTPASKAPAAETPATNTPVNDTAASNTPAADTTATNAPATSTPAAETPATTIPVNGTSATNAPAADTPATNTLTTATPATNTPVNDTATTVQPGAGAQVIAVPPYNSLKNESPAINVPVNETTSGAAPATNTPVDDTAATVEPGAGAPVITVPAYNTGANQNPANAPASNTTAAPALAANMPVNDTASNIQTATNTLATAAPAPDTMVNNNTVEPGAGAPVITVPPYNTSDVQPAADDSALNVPAVRTPANETAAAPKPVVNNIAATAPATNGTATNGTNIPPLNSTAANVQEPLNTPPSNTEASNDTVANLPPSIAVRETSVPATPNVVAVPVVPQNGAVQATDSLDEVAAQPMSNRLG